MQASRSGPKFGDPETMSKIMPDTVMGSKCLKLSSTQTLERASNLKSQVGSQTTEDTQETIRKTATMSGKVLMEYDYKRDTSWANSKDRSQWFNYGFDHYSFKDWLQKQLDRRLHDLQAALAARKPIVTLDEDTCYNYGSTIEQKEWEERYTTEAGPFQCQPEIKHSDVQDFLQKKNRDHGDTSVHLAGGYMGRNEVGIKETTDWLDRTRMQTESDDITKPDLAETTVGGCLGAAADWTKLKEFLKDAQEFRLTHAGDDFTDS